MKIYLPIVSGKPKAKPLRVVTYNIGDDSNTDTMPVEQRMANVATQLLVQTIDVACLQEVVWKGDRAEIAELARHLGGWHLFGEVHNRQNHYQNVILSRFPFVAGSELTHTIKSAAGRQDRVNLSVKIETPLGDIRVFNVHTRFEEPGEGTRQALEWVKELDDEPYLVAGDFNKTRGGLIDIMQELDMQMIVSRAGRIDHIAVRGLKIVDDQAIAKPNVASSHYPVFAVLDLVD